LDRVVGSVSFGNFGNSMGGGAGERKGVVKKPEMTDFKKNGCVSEGEVSREDGVVVVGLDR
jgi:hypothetical protein